ncbi:hypothetical protein OGATHE_004884, partial [Ogataea polymorpha]
KQEEAVIEQVLSRESEVKPQPEVKVDEEDMASVPAKRTYRQKLGIVETEYNDKRPYWVIMIRPLMIGGLPAVFWGGFVYGVQVM